MSVPRTMVALSEAYVPPLLKGVKVYADNPFRLDFIVDQGDSGIPGKAVIPSEAAGRVEGSQQKEFIRLIKYFLASVTVPEDDLWVNLSPYEKDRIVPDAFGVTEMGRDLLAQDYMLKQITASVIYPEGEVGKAFWAKVYAEAEERYGTTDIPVDTFNKVWIIPEKAVVYEGTDSAYVVESRLKVMLETDYLATTNNLAPTRGHDALQQDNKQGIVSPSTLPTPQGLNTKATQGSTDTPSDLAKEILREIIIPILEKEVNEGKNFAQLRQVYHSLILAVWYKDKIKESLLGKAYVDQQKIRGVDIEDKAEKEKIWAQYVEAFKKGAYNYIKEEKDVVSGDVIPRKYFSGGLKLDVRAVKRQALRSELPKNLDHAEVVKVELDSAENVKEIGLGTLDLNDKSRHELVRKVFESIGQKTYGNMGRDDAFQIAMVLLDEKSLFYPFNNKLVNTARIAEESGLMVYRIPQTHLSLFSGNVDLLYSQEQVRQILFEDQELGYAGQRLSSDEIKAALGHLFEWNIIGEQGGEGEKAGRLMGYPEGKPGDQEARFYLVKGAHSDQYLDIEGDASRIILDDEAIEIYGYSFQELTDEVRQKCVHDLKVLKNIAEMVGVSGKIVLELPEGVSSKEAGNDDQSRAVSDVLQKGAGNVSSARVDKIAFQSYQPKDAVGLDDGLVGDIIPVETVDRDQYTASFHRKIDDLMVFFKTGYSDIERQRIFYELSMAKTPVQLEYRRDENHGMTTTLWVKTDRRASDHAQTGILFEMGKELAQELWEEVAHGEASARGERQKYFQKAFSALDKTALTYVVMGKASNLRGRVSDLLEDIGINWHMVSEDVETWALLSEVTQNMEVHAGKGAVVLSVHHQASGNVELEFFAVNDGQGFRYDRENRRLPIAEALRRGVTSKKVPKNGGYGLDVVVRTAKSFFIVERGPEGGSYYRSENGVVLSGSLSDADAPFRDAPQGVLLYWRGEMSSDSTQAKRVDVYRKMAQEGWEFAYDADSLENFLSRSYVRRDKDEPMRSLVAVPDNGGVLRGSLDKLTDRLRQTQAFKNGKIVFNADQGPFGLHMTALNSRVIRELGDAALEKISKEEQQLFSFGADVRGAYINSYNGRVSVAVYDEKDALLKFRDQMDQSHQNVPIVHIAVANVMAPLTSEEREEWISAVREFEFIFFGRMEIKNFILLEHTNDVMRGASVVNNKGRSPILDKLLEPTLVDKDAVEAPGGIDLTRDRMSFQNQSNGKGVQFNFDPVMSARTSSSGEISPSSWFGGIRQFQNASGLTPVIIDIQPMTTSVPLFLGLNNDI